MLIFNIDITCSIHEITYFLRFLILHEEASSAIVAQYVISPSLSSISFLISPQEVVLYRSIQAQVIKVIILINKKYLEVRRCVCRVVEKEGEIDFLLAEQ